MARVVLAAALAVHAAGVVLAAFGEIKARATVAQQGAVVLAAAWAGQLAALILFGISASAVPLRSGPEYLFVLGWLVLTLHLVLWFRMRVKATALVLPPVAGAMMLAVYLLSVGAPRATALDTRGWFVFHTAIATAGVAALAVSFAMSVLFLVKEHALKSKRSLRVLERLPALEALDRLGFQSLLYGFPLLTLGIVTGMAYSAAEHDRVLIWGVKEVFPLIAWVVFAGILWARLASGTRGKQSAILAIAGFAFALLTFVGMVR